MAQSEKLYESVVSITQTYLGPAADRFIVRQIRNHLRKDPQQLARRDLADLIDWIRVAMSFLTDDRDLIESYIKDLDSLTKLKEQPRHE